MTDIIDKVLFKDLEACDPEEVISRIGCTFDKNTGSYGVRIWGKTYEVNPSRAGVRVPQGNSHGEYMELFLLHYLMKARSIPLSGVWVSEKDIPSGAAFFRGPHTLPTHLIVQVFGSDPDGFAARCETLGGTSLDMADQAYGFEITPRIPVAVLFWQGDEDFGAESRLLFDKTIAQHLPLDIVYALAVQVCRTVSGER
ncbi:DUF3786 domain-containing protein [Desulfospira joergensenii]|uniref:DUF3786 domain-containing protein n=1 Tax=Desulfospira joergensenii TaxID=53329 RepID=UPI0003B45BBF|nr:DUF3786 domain-containing protein [Desulfospira joergensenii]